MLRIAGLTISPDGVDGWNARFTMSNDAWYKAIARFSAKSHISFTRHRRGWEEMEPFRARNGTEGFRRKTSLPLILRSVKLLFESSAH